MMHNSLFCVPTINNNRKAVLGIYNQDLFYQGFFHFNNIKLYNYTQEYWQNLNNKVKLQINNYILLLLELSSIATILSKH